MHESNLFRGCLASPHWLATEAGAGVLSQGGNAADAAIAACCALSVVAPYEGGPGGDVFALIGVDRVHCYNGSGRAPRAASLQSAREVAGDGMPRKGPLTVTVPGAVDAWFEIVERFGSLSFAQISARAQTLAAEGFLLSPRDVTEFRAAQPRGSSASYGELQPGGVLRQTGLARLFGLLSEAGRGAFYGGEPAEDIASVVAKAGGALRPADLDAHEGEWVEPLARNVGGVTIHVPPPNSQGIALLESLALVQERGIGTGGQCTPQDLAAIAALRIALNDRDRLVGDPRTASVAVEAMLSDRRLREMASKLGDGALQTSDDFRARQGGTASVCAVDADGMAVSLLQSNFSGFGSGLAAERWGVHLHNRGSSFSFDPDSPNVLGPYRRPLHSLMPVLLSRGGRTLATMGTMGGAGQPSILLQVIRRLLAGEPPNEAVSAPRWVLSSAAGSVRVEPGLSPELVGGLQAEAHAFEVIRRRNAFEAGLVQVIDLSDGTVRAASDPRGQGAAITV